MNIIKKTMRFITISLAALLLSGCPDGIAPDAKITFPTKMSLTDADFILVKGRSALHQHEKIIAWKHEQGEPPTIIAAVRINGVAASSDDGFATWQARVPLTAGMNTLVVETEDSDGDINPAAATVRVAQEKNLIPNGAAVEYTPGSDALMVAGNITNAVLRVDLASGERSLVSGQGAGSGPEVVNMLDFVLDPQGATGYAADVGANVVVAIDMASGARRIISGAGVGGGPAITGRARALTFDPGNNRLLSAGTMDLDGEGAIAFALFAIDLATGDRTVITDDLTNTDPALTLEQPFRIAVDNANNRALVYVWKLFVSASDRRTGTVVAVDLTDGSRSVLSDLDIGAGPLLTGSLGTSLSPFDNNILISAEPAKEQILITDLRSGDRRPLIAGPDLGSPFGLSVDPDRNLVYSAGNRGVYSVDLADAERRIISQFSVGRGPVVSSAQKFIVNGKKTTALAVDREIRMLVSFDLRSGKRRIVSNDLRGEGDGFVYPQQLQWDEAGGRAFVSDVVLEPSGDGGFVERAVIRKVDVMSGDRSVLIDSNSEQCGVPVGQVWDRRNGRLLVINAEAIVSVDPDSGACAVLTPLTLSGELSLSDIAIDDIGNRLLASGRLGDALGILQMDLADGQVSFVSGGGVGAGASFDVPRGSLGGLALDAENNRVVVTSFNSRLEATRVRRVVAVDLASGDRRTLSDNSSRVGPIYGEMNDVALDRSGNILLLDGAMDAVYLIDDESGERVLLSR